MFLLTWRRLWEQFTLTEMSNVTLSVLSAYPAIPSTAPSCQVAARSVGYTNGDRGNSDDKPSTLGTLRRGGKSVARFSGNACETPLFSPLHANLVSAFLPDHISPLAKGKHHKTRLVDMRSSSPCGMELTYRNGGSWGKVDDGLHCTVDFNAIDRSTADARLFRNSPGVDLTLGHLRHDER